MYRLRSRSVRLLAVPALAVPLVFAAVLALPSAASAKGAAKPKPVACSHLSGNTGTTVVLSGCTNGGTVNESGGGGTFAVFALSPTGGSNTLDWNNGATVNFHDTPTVEKKDHCPGAPTTIEAKISGSVTSNGSLPAGDPGVKNPVKALVCATAVGAGFQVSLEKGTFKI